MIFNINLRKLLSQYGEDSVMAGIHFFLIFAAKHRLWVLVRINVSCKNKKNIKKYHLKMNIFTVVKYCSILHRRVCVMIIMIHENIAFGVHG